MDQFPFSVNLALALLAIWSVVWKIYAAWTAAKHDHKKWFVAVLILNTVGILEIFYLFKIAKKSWTEVKEDFRGAFNPNK